MKSLNFRDAVLWPVAYKMGLDPATNFESTQAKAIGVYINSWVRRLYTSADWPEWEVIEEFGPVNHIVPYAPGVFSTPNQRTIDKVLSVHLIDPRTTTDAVDTPFTESEQGIHVGFDHGSTVWIKYIPVCPIFTAVPWTARGIYRKNDVTYSPVSGECYRSLVNNNIGHDPSLTDAPHDIPLNTEQTQDWTPDQPGVQAINQIYDIDLSTITGPDPAGTINYVSVFDAPNGTQIAAVAYTGGANETPEQIRDGLIALLVLEAGLSTFTITPEDAPVRIRLEDATNFSVQPQPYSQSTGTGVATYFKVRQVQVMQPAVAAAQGLRQTMTLTLSEDQVQTGATYQLNFTDHLGELHTAEYVAIAGDGISNIMAGLIAAVTAQAAGPDTWFTDVFTAVDSTGTNMTLSVGERVGFDPLLRPAPVPTWAIVPFPADLVDAVVRGANADTLKEWGQSDRGGAEEQGVPTEAQMKLAVSGGQAFDQLTDRQGRRSRYAAR